MADTLANLVTPSTPAEVLTLELAVAQQLELSVTSWEPLDPSRTLFQINANIVSLYSGTVNLIAQGGYASYAAQMVDANGSPITAWMDLLTPNNYYTYRFAVAQAAGSVPVTNASATPQNYAPNNPLHFQYPTSGATYTSQGTGTILGSSSTTVQVAADPAFAGSAGNAPIGAILQLVTPLPGVSVTALTVALVGTPQESNSALLLRSQNKLGSLSVQLSAIQQGTTTVPPSPGAPVSAYDYVATSIPQSSSGASSSWPYYVGSRINRSQTFGNTSTGVVQVYLANAAGGAPAPDVTAVQAALAALATTQCVTLNAQAASNLSIVIVYTIYFRRNAGYSVTQINSAILSALTAYFSAFPIGGVNTTAQGILPFAEVEDVIFDALPGCVDLALTLNGAAANVALGTGVVAQLGTITPTVSFV